MPDGMTQLPMRPSADGKHTLVWSCHPTTHILYDPLAITAPEPEWAFVDHWKALGHSAIALGGRGSAHRIEANGLATVLRRYRRGGWMAKLSHDGYLFNGLERTRSIREARLLFDLHTQGLQVPRPLLATVERTPHGLGRWVYRQALMTQWIEGAQPLSEISEEISADQWDALAEVLARLLDAGVFHPDLNANNILQGGDGRWWVIDFDRARIGPTPRPGRRMIRRLCQSFNKLGLRAPFTADQFFERMSSHRQARSSPEST